LDNKEDFDSAIINKCRKLMRQSFIYSTMNYHTLLLCQPLLNPCSYGCQCKLNPALLGENPATYPLSDGCSLKVTSKTNKPNQPNLELWDTAFNRH